MSGEAFNARDYLMSTTFEGVAQAHGFELVKFKAETSRMYTKPYANGVLGFVSVVLYPADAEMASAWAQKLVDGESKWVFPGVSCGTPERLNQALMAMDKKLMPVKEALGDPDPGPELEPEENDPDEEPFDARDWLLAGGDGAIRKEWVEKHLREIHGDYIVNSAYTGYGADFYSQANWRYLKDNYSWLNYQGEGIGFDPAKLEHPEDPTEAISFEDYLGDIDNDEWDDFKEKVSAIRHGDYCLDDDEANRLEMEAVNEWWHDNYEDLREALRKTPWARNDYLLFLINKLDEEDCVSLANEHDVYCEDQGEGTVWLNVDELAKEITPNEVKERVDDPSNQDEWEDTKHKVLNRLNGPLELFDNYLKLAVQTDPEAQRRYQQLDANRLQEFFNDLIDNPPYQAGEDYPRWTWVKTGYGDDTPNHWEVMYPMDRVDWYKLGRDGRNDHIQGGMEEFVDKYAVRALKTWGHVPKVHPEFWPEMPSTHTMSHYDESQEPFNARDYVLDTGERELIAYLESHGWSKDSDSGRYSKPVGMWFYWVHAEIKAFVNNPQLVANPDIWFYRSYHWEHPDGDKAQTKTWVVKDDGEGYPREIQPWVERVDRPSVAEAEELPPPEDDEDFDPHQYWTEFMDTGTVVKDTPTMRVLKPTVDTINHFVERNRQGANYTHIPYKDWVYMVIPKDNSQRYLVGVGETGALYTPCYDENVLQAVLKTKSYSKDLRRFFRRYITEFLRDGQEAMAMRLVAQMYGAKATLKYLDRYEVPSDITLGLGIQLAQAGDAKTAAKLLNFPEERIGVNGATWVLKDWSDLADLFAPEDEDRAHSILSGEEVEADWLYDKSVRPKIDEVTNHISASNFKLIRELLPHRTIYPYADGHPLMLSTENLKEFDDADIVSWLDDQQEYDPNEELEDIRDALIHAAIDAWRDVLNNDFFEGYKNEALNAIDADYDPNSLTFEVPWKSLQTWLSEAEGDEIKDLNDLMWNHAPRAHADEDYSSTSWSESGNLNDYIDSTLSELEFPDFPYDPKQMTMPQVMGPDPHEKIEQMTYGPHSPHGYQSKMERKTFDEWKRKEPWRLDPELWRQHAQQIGFTIPPKPTVGESVARTLLEQNYSDACAMIDVPPPQSDFIFEWGRLNIPDENLQATKPDQNPRELEQHVTVKWGMTVNEVPDELREICKQIKPFPVYIGKVSLFRNPECDVVKLDVESPWLRKLNSEITAAIPAEDTHPDYHPHVTVAYVKKGSCDKLDGVDIFQNGQQTGVDPQFIVYGLKFKGAGESGSDSRTEEHLLFSRVKKPLPVKPVAVESGPFDGLPFPASPDRLKQFFQSNRSRVKRPIL